MSCAWKTRAISRFLNLSIAELAAATGKDPVDALLDLALDERMELGVTLSVINVNPDVVSRILQAAQHADRAERRRRARRAALRRRPDLLPAA